jgi:hypothetical protein
MATLILSGLALAPLSASAAGSDFHDHYRDPHEVRVRVIRRDPYYRHGYSDRVGCSHP